MKRAALLLVVGGLLAPASLLAQSYYDVTGTIKDDPLCTTAPESATVTLYTSTNCASGTSAGETGINDNGDYQFCDITTEPKSIRVYIDDCHDECYNLGPIWAGSSSCGHGLGTQNSQTKNACPINSCD